VNRGLRRRLAPAAVTASLLASCTGVADLHIPTPPVGSPNAAGATTTVTSDLTAVSLNPVGSTPPTAVVLTPGDASLSGIVTGPTGPIGGATVLVERLVGDSVGGKTVAAQADGTWKLGGIKGGRYRIRAWRPPDLAMLTPQVVLLGATDNPSVTLPLMAYNGQSVTAAVAPSPPQVGQAATLVVQATQQAVGGDGIVRAGPLTGSNVFVLAAGNVLLTGTNPGPTDAGGKLAVLLTCVTAGPVGLSASLDGLTTFPLTVPDCVPAAVPAPPSTPTTGPGGTATTVKPPTSTVP
jgi:hypothetical protein